MLINQYLSWFNSERCEDLRTVNSQRFTQEAKRGQEYQIREREYIKEQEQEVERIWAEISKKQQEEKVINNIFTSNSKFHSKWQTELAIRDENVSFLLPNT